MVLVNLLPESAALVVEALEKLCQMAEVDTQLHPLEAVVEEENNLILLHMEETVVQVLL